MRALLLLPLLAALPSCGSDAAPAPVAPPCEAECKDEVALKGIRETLKLAFNLTFQGKPVGNHDLSTPCPLGGTARVVGTATSNALQGTTEVSILYELTDCAYFFDDDDPEDNYDLVISGQVVQKGILAVQPTTPSAVTMTSPSLVVKGTVYDPPLPYEATCALNLAQNGNTISGVICDRKATSDL